MFDFLLCALACFRLARLVAIDEGPFSVFQHLRQRAGAYEYDAQGRVKTAFGRGISCPYCVGVYAALLLAVLQRLQLPGTSFLVNVLALAGAQSAIQATTKE